MYRQVTREEARILLDAGVQLGFAQHGLPEEELPKPISMDTARVALKYRIVGLWFAKVEEL